MHGKIFTRFLLDVGADFLLDQIESIRGMNWLEFCGIPAPTISMISIEQQFAEKLHAYTLPRAGKVNSRAKDLVDMVLLLNMRPLKLEQITQTAHKVFEKRATHPLPQKLEKPPAEWESQFQIMATECGLSLDMQASFNKISIFYDGMIEHFLKKMIESANI